MRLYIDGYNLLHQTAGAAPLLRRDLGQARDALIRRLVEYAEVRAHQVVVVFDAGEGVDVPWTPPRTAQVEVIFSQRGERADDVLMRTARERGEGTVVVSSDREVVEAVRRSGGVAVASHVFEARVRRALAGLPSRSDPEGRGKEGGPARRPPRAERRALRVLEKL